MSSELETLKIKNLELQAQLDELASQPSYKEGYDRGLAQFKASQKDLVKERNELKAQCEKLAEALQYIANNEQALDFGPYSDFASRALAEYQKFKEQK